MSEKYSQKLLDHAKQSAIDALGEFIGNKIANRITKVSKNSWQKHSETVTKENDKEISKERKIYFFRRKTENYWSSKINIIL